MNNKKGAVGIAFVWILAIFAFAIISVIFISGVLTLSEKKGAGSDASEALAGVDTGIPLALEENFEEFLSSEVVFDGKSMSILELVEENKIEKGAASDAFVSSANETFSSIFPLEGWTWEHPWWVRAYNLKDNMNADENFNGYFNEGYFSAGSFNCNPSNLEENFVLIYFSASKKVALCVSKEYYSFLEDKKSE